MIWKPTPAQCNLIRAYARLAADAGLVRLEVGKRCNTEKVDVEENINIRLVSDDPHWNDTDLFDFVDWKFFRRFGVDLTDDGKALIDIYVSTVGHYAELRTNIQVYYENGRIVRMSQTGGPDAELVN